MKGFAVVSWLIKKKTLYAYIPKKCYIQMLDIQPFTLMTCLLYQKMKALCMSPRKENQSIAKFSF